MAGIVVDDAEGSAGHRRRRQPASSTSSAASPSTRSATRTRRWVEAIQEQVARGVGRLVHLARRASSCSSGSRATPPAHGVHRLQLYSGGAEAVESALRLAKSPHRQVRVRQLLGRLPRQDHGRAVADGLDVQGQARADGAGRAPGAVRRLLPLPARLELPELRHRLRRGRRASTSRSRPPARSPRVIVEPMQGTAGNVIPPKEFLPAMQSIADEVGALLIADEMITGLGRTGTLLGRRPHRRPARHRHDRQGVRRRLPAVGAR